MKNKDLNILELTYIRERLNLAEAYINFLQEVVRNDEVDVKALKDDLYRCCDFMIRTEKRFNELIEVNKDES